MKHSNNLSYDGKDTIEIPAVSKKTSDAAILIIMSAIMVFIALNIDKMFIFSALLIFVSIACVISIYLLIKPIMFLLCKKKNIKFEFNAEGFVYSGKTIKWADIKKIEYKEFIYQSKHTRYHIKVYYEGMWIVNDVLKNKKNEVKRLIPLEITENIILKPGSKKIAELIADKFYRYYGAANGLMLKKRLFMNKYELKPYLQQKTGYEHKAEVFTDTPDNTAQIPSLFR